MTTNTYVYFVMDKYASATDVEYLYSIVCPQCNKTISSDSDPDCRFSLTDYHAGTPFTYVVDGTFCEHVDGYPFCKEIYCAPMDQIETFATHRDGERLEPTIEEIKAAHPCFVELLPEPTGLPPPVPENWRHWPFQERRVFSVGVLEILSVGGTDQGCLKPNQLPEDLVHPAIVKYRTHTRHKDGETYFLRTLDRYKADAEGYDVYDVSANEFEARCRSCKKEHLTSTWDD